MKEEFLYNGKDMSPLQQAMELDAELRSRQECGHGPQVQTGLTNLPKDAEGRKACPVGTGVFKYFPKALVEISKVSRAGGQQHLPGQPLHWDRSKSTDDFDAACRHLLESGGRDTDGQRHTAKAAWRILAVLEKELEEGER